MLLSERLVSADLGETGLAGDEAAAGPGHRPEDVAGARAGSPRRHERALIPTPLLNIRSGQDRMIVKIISFSVFLRSIILLAN